MKVITRAETISRDKIPKAIKHDFRLTEIPHADSSKPINIVYKSTYAVEIDGKRYVPIIRDWNDLTDAIFGYWNYVNYLRVKEGKKPFRKNTRPVVEFIIAFDKEARDFVNNPANWQKLDERAKKYIELLKDKFGIIPLVAVRHSDETTTHYHILFINYSKKHKKTFTKLFKSRREFSQLQDLVADVFSDLGFKRGEKYNPEIHKHKAIHKSVRELHKDLPKEIEQKRKELQQLENLIKEKEKLLREKEAVLININKEVGRLKPTLQSLQSRKRKEEEELQKLLRQREEEERELARLKEQKEKLQQELARLQEILKGLEERNKKLQAEETELKQRLETENQQLKKIQAEIKSLQTAFPEATDRELSKLASELATAITRSFNELSEEIGLIRKEKVLKEEKLNNFKSSVVSQVAPTLKKLLILAKKGKMTEKEIQNELEKLLKEKEKEIETAMEKRLKLKENLLTAGYRGKIQNLEEKIAELKEEMQIYKEIADIFKVNTPYEAEIRLEHYRELEKKSKQLEEKIKKLEGENNELINKIWTIRQLLNQIGLDVYEQNGEIVITRYQPPSQGQGKKLTR